MGEQRHFVLIGKTISGIPFKLSKQDRYIHLERCRGQIQNYKNRHEIEYSIDELKLSIDMDNEPCRIPTKNNAKEIGRIFGSDSK